LPKLSCYRIKTGSWLENISWAFGLIATTIGNLENSNYRKETNWAIAEAFGPAWSKHVLKEAQVDMIWLICIYRRVLKESFPFMVILHDVAQKTKNKEIQGSLLLTLTTSEDLVRSF
jgi:hypothetical protein